MATISEDDLYATVGRLYVLWLVEQRDHNQTRQSLAEIRQASMTTEDDSVPTPIAPTAVRRKGG